jgi:hypothetical protein
MDSDELEFLIKDICEGLSEDKKDQVKKLANHTYAARDLVSELSEGLEDDSLLEQVEELLGD